MDELFEKFNIENTQENKDILTILLENWFSVKCLKSYADRMTKEYENDNLYEYDRNSEKLLKNGIDLYKFDSYDKQQVEMDLVESIHKMFNVETLDDKWQNLINDN